jgi:hypothetical protein
MNKLLSSVGLAIVFATMSLLAGCQLYFGDHSNSSGGGTGSGGPGNPPGFKCDGDAQCAAGCFCAEGVCAEGGFCGMNKDCGTGFHCDTTRSSCVPDPTCTANEQCTPGSMCDAATGGCTTTCKCLSDADAVRQGAGWCDETRGTCMPGKDPAGACTGTITCTTAGPKCPDGQVPLRKDGCYTGQCRAITACEAPPVCNALQHEGDCLGRSADCSSVYNGHGCTKPDGSACRVGDTNCTCTSFTFAACENKGATATLILFGE